MTSFGIGCSCRICIVFTSNLLIEKPVELDEHHEEADILFIGFISSKGAIQEGFSISKFDVLRILFSIC
jgi:hypothetical protein